MEKGLLVQPPTATATRPPSPLSSSPSPAASNIVVDCLKFVSSWSLRGRRGRKRTPPPLPLSTATTIYVIARDQLNMKRSKIETHSDHKRPLKKNGGFREGIYM
ncbi:TPRXL protein [Cucumis melo var. makuwa]|uniref:TPRXL protein n=1 Tax=Cucumis melo var. makuwa TaxID=1194695 RepID=A0A5D3D759_CUCMM|nr:TPRXL protein [Cucumis melo var. makuwa]